MHFPRESLLGIKMPQDLSHGSLNVFLKNDQAVGGTRKPCLEVELQKGISYPQCMEAQL